MEDGWCPRSGRPSSPLKMSYGVVRDSRHPPPRYEAGHETTERQGS